MEVNRKLGCEKFCAGDQKLAFTLLDFWQWSQSDMLNNTLRGVLAEYIVCKALHITSQVRYDWEAFDLLYDTHRIEVKSSAYVQSWSQPKNSKISFDIRPTKSWCEETRRRSLVACRQSDFYVFCLLAHQDKETINPLDLFQWSFYVLPTKTLNAKVADQKSITLNSLLSLGPIQCAFFELKSVVNSLAGIN